MHGIQSAGVPLHVAHFVHRYPPALGGAEAYFARLSEYLAGCGDVVDVWTTTAVELAEMWGKSDPTPRPPHLPPPPIRPESAVARPAPAVATPHLTK